jgi:hypothetical protein
MRVLRATPEGSDEQTIHVLILGIGALGFTLELRDGRVRVDTVNHKEPATVATLTGVHLSAELEEFLRSRMGDAGGPQDRPGEGGEPLDVMDEADGEASARKKQN